MVEPERELVRRALPFAVPALVVAFAAGALLGGLNAAWSAAIGVAVVTANFAAYGLSLAWAAAISPMALMVVGLGGFIVRLAVIVLLLVGLTELSWFSPVAFLAAVIPATALLLGFEMKVISGRLQADLWQFPSQGAR
jgi:hypothetical protein